MRQAIRAGQQDQAINDGKRLIGESGHRVCQLRSAGTGQAVHGRGEKAAARNHLQWVTESAPDVSLKELARLRLGRLLLDMNELDALKKLLSPWPRRSPVSSRSCAETSSTRAGTPMRRVWHTRTHCSKGRGRRTAAHEACRRRRPGPDS